MTASRSGERARELGEIRDLTIIGAGPVGLCAATGFGEAAVAVAQALQAIRPDMGLQPSYSTTTGVPGVIAGQP